MTSNRLGYRILWVFYIHSVSQSTNKALCARPCGYQDKHDTSGPVWNEVKSKVNSLALPLISYVTLGSHVISLCQFLLLSNGMAMYPRNGQHFGSSCYYYFPYPQITPVWWGRLTCRLTITMPGAELGMGHPGSSGEGLFPGLHFTNIYGELLCARRCAGHWGHRDERDTLSTHPSSSLPSPLPPGPSPRTLP